jgi:serine/threonine-protein kinase RsbW
MNTAIAEAQMQPVIGITYPGKTENVRTVRADLRPLLDGCPAADEALLCASELAANAALHSRSALASGEFTVRITLRPGSHVRIEIHDQGGSWTPPNHDRSQSHGLDIVDALAADWGVEGDYRARIFWARLNWQPSTAPPAGQQKGPAGLDVSPAAILARAGKARLRGQWIVTLDPKQLRQLRRLHGLSQQQLARQAGISITTLGRLESQTRPRCRPRTMILLATALGEHPAAIARGLTLLTQHPPASRAAANFGPPPVSESFLQDTKGADGEGHLA